jgi:NDP-sugar pyrophosphorylase family protein
MDRERLTITLKKDVLDRLDATIDGARIRNRSHAIEYHLGRALGSGVQKALILAGGKGVKMRPFTYELPKSLIPVHGKPILEYTIEMLRDAGIRTIIINVGHRGEKIEEYFGDGSRFGVSITYAHERRPEGTAGPLRLVEKQLRGSPFLLVYGDVLIELNLHDLIDFHLEEGGEATLAITSVPDPADFGVVRVHGAKVVEFLEKPPDSRRLSRLVNTGVYVMDPAILKRIPKQGHTMLETDVFPALAKERKLNGFLFEGQWFDVGTPEIYERVLKEWKK